VKSKFLSSNGENGYTKVHPLVGHRATCGLWLILSAFCGVHPRPPLNGGESGKQPASFKGNLVRDDSTIAAELTGSLRQRPLQESSSRSAPLHLQAEDLARFALGNHLERPPADLANGREPFN
jgi:hypothetical protein